MILGATCGTRIHAPAGTRIAYVSAYTSGADLLHVPVALTRDERVVVAADRSLVEGKTFEELRRIDIGASFHEADGTAFRHPARIELLATLLDHVPASATLLVEASGQAKAVVDQTCAEMKNRGRIASLIVAVTDADAHAAGRRHGARVAWVTAGQPPTWDVDAVVLPIEVVLAADGVTPLGEEIARRHEAGALALGAIVRLEGVASAELLRATSRHAWIHAVSVDSVPEAAAVLRPGWQWVREEFSATAESKGDVDTDQWHLGYAKNNRACHVYVDSGVHVDIAPYEGEVGRASDDPLTRALDLLKERGWDALRDWPFYAGGGFGHVIGVDGDFAAEVDVESRVASQATTVEMAAVNVDPGAHRKPWNADGSPNLTRSHRDKDSFYDPHGAPPYVGVEHDEADGWRINWNLGTEYDQNQYGRPFGDGKILKARMRLERRGSYWSAWYRGIGKSGVRDWVCVGVARNDSMNARVFLRCVGKRWRQENAANPSEWMPVVANHFVFRNFTITRFP